MSLPAATSLPFKISVLVFIKDSQGRQLLIQRLKAPNLNCWSPIGGKLEMGEGESPFECAVRETGEETGLNITAGDLHLFGMISERGYEGSGHWLMFLFDCHKPLEALPATIDEGQFGFFSRSEVDSLALPPSDRTLVWPVYDKHRHSFLAYRAECDPAQALTMTEEESHLSPHLKD
ncbi:MAG: NUDIX domain-containing protein [Puniceicoccales bacterium]|jgi:8-oxo-dGTP diphosphatase|nr:NUDIX domain-containing protein [Puniceicoccales bacterium]